MESITHTQKIRVLVVDKGRYRCVKVTRNPVAAQKAEDTYRHLGYLTRQRVVAVRGVK